MSNSARLLVTAFAFLALPWTAVAGSVSDDGIWTDVEGRVPAAGPALRTVVPSVYRTVALNRPALEERLRSAPLERTPAAERSPLVLTLPAPGGSWERFSVVESPVLEAPLAERFPEIRTYEGQGIDDPASLVRFDVTPFGFHAIVLSPTGTIYIDPYQRGDLDHYVSYFKHDLPLPQGKTFRCELAEVSRGADRLSPLHGALTVPSGTTLRTYRLALAATAQYTAFYGGTVSGALAGMTTTVNRVNAVYGRDLAIRLTLVANTSSLIYTNAATQPYTNNDGSKMLDQNQTNVDTVIGNANYDIGHVFSTGGGGIAELRAVCVAGSKARGVTGSSQPVGDPFDVDYVCHEMGHQFGGSHPFNADGSSSGFCNGNREPTAAYETGSGSTIMGYAGICAGEDLQPHSDDYFHAKSLDEILTYVTAGSGSSCPGVTSTGNQPPTVSAGSGFTIPARTPFTLTASGSDPNGDALTYTWEQYDLGNPSPPDTDDGSRPIFRSFQGTTSPSRTFPRLQDVLSGIPTFGESLPTTSRTLTFKVTARDNRAGGGGRSDSSTQLSVVSSAGPFTVTQPGAGASWAGGSSQTVAWIVASTSSAPVSCGTVNIALSTDGGSSFGTTLASGVPNTGLATVTAPGFATTSARVRVACANNVFFNVSPANFTLTGGGGGPCTPSPTTLCISTRFQVQVAWSTSQGGGQSGQGNAVSASSIGFTSGGIFWFFSANNPEMLVKVLNGCSTNNRYWVFASAGTNVGLSLTVTDTQSGQTKTYTNPDLTPAQPIQDTGAFATCP